MVLGAPAIEAMTWSDFVARFRAEFAPAMELQQLARKFLDMRQTTETVAEITAKFWERALLVPQYAGDEVMKRTHYHDMLRADIREHVCFSACPTLVSMIPRAREREIDLEHIQKRKAEEGQTTGVRGGSPRDPMVGRKASQDGTAMGNAVGHMRGLVALGRDPAAISVASLGILAEIILPLLLRFRHQT